MGGGALGLSKSDLVVRDHLRNQGNPKQSKRQRRRQDSTRDGIMNFEMGRQGKVTKYTTRGKEGFDINLTSGGLSK